MRFTKQFVFDQKSPRKVIINIWDLQINFVVNYLTKIINDILECFFFLNESMTHIFEQNIIQKFENGYHINALFF